MAAERIQSDLRYPSAVLDRRYSERSAAHSLLEMFKPRRAECGYFSGGR
jgi:hypothetical protein